MTRGAFLAAWAAEQHLPDVLPPPSQQYITNITFHMSKSTRAKELYYRSYHHCWEPMEKESFVDRRESRTFRPDGDKTPNTFNRCMLPLIGVYYLQQVYTTSNRYTSNRCILPPAGACYLQQVHATSNRCMLPPTAACYLFFSLALDLFLRRRRRRRRRCT